MSTPDPIPPPEHFPTAGGPTIMGLPDVYPILALEPGTTLETSKAPRFAGTGFRIGPDVLVTCWHCVKNENCGYVLSRGEQSGGAVVYPLTDITQDTNGSDLATAKIDEDLTTDPVRLRLSNLAAAPTADVWTTGYPLPRPCQQDGKVQLELDGRILRGYVTRSFIYEHPAYGKTRSYEIDMPAPEGLSGAPLMLHPGNPGNHVVGVIYGENYVDSIEALASIDPETKVRTPEVVRRVSFALAHFTSTLYALRGRATDNKPLVEYLGSNQ